MYKDVLNVFENIDPKQVYILDKGFKEFKKSYSGIYQNLEKDIVSILTKQQQLLKKYKRLFLLAPDNNSSKEILDGFRKFSKSDLITCAIIDSVEIKNIKKGDAFIAVDDDQLVELVNCLRSSGFTIGKDTGVLSYHESNLKSVIGDGISTITPDYTAMGRTMAKMITSNERKVIENPFIMIDRGSF
ncbi:MAG: hypothetical protein EOO02_17300 [Chitinophagaceae bacterium]|nr:MAG: hypothetical protein EOO02_17300 [Chitinophagaceae bacterium]